MIKRSKANKEQMNWHDDGGCSKNIVIIPIDAIVRLVSLRRTLLVAVGVTIPNNAMEKL